MGISSLGYQLFSDPQHWERFWSIEYKRPIHKVDFKKHFVIYITLGQKKTGGYSVNIVQAILQTGPANVKAIKVVLKIEEPSPGQGVDLGETTPYIIARFKRPIFCASNNQPGRWQIEFFKQLNGQHSPLDVKAIPQKMPED